MARCAVVAGAVLLSACFSGSPPRAPAPAPASPAAPPAPRGPDYSDVLADPLGFLRADTDFAFGIDMDALRASQLWPGIWPHIASNLPEVTQLSRCGFDPEKSIHAITFGIVRGPQTEGVVVASGLDRGRVMACMAKPQPQGQVASIADGIVTLAIPDGNKLTFTFVGASTVVAVAGPNADAEQLRAVLRAGRPLRANARFTALAARTSFDGALWMVIDGQIPLIGMMMQSGLAPRGSTGSIALDRGFALAARLHFDDPAKAQQFQQLIAAQIAPARPYVDKLDVTADATDTVVDMAMTEAQLTAAIQNAGFLSP